MLNPPNNLTAEQKEQAPWCQEREPTLQRNPTKAEKKQKKKPWLVFLCRTPIENNDIWDVDELFVLYTASK